MNDLNLYFFIFASIFSSGAILFYFKNKTRIPNYYTLAGFSIAFLIRLILAFNSFEYLKSSLLGLFLVVLVFFPLFTRYLIGGGNLKILLGLGILLGFEGTLWLIALTTIWDIILLLFYGLWSFKRCLILKFPFTLKHELTDIIVYFQDITSNKKPYSLSIFLGCLSYILLYLCCNQFIIYFLANSCKLAK